MTGRDDFDRTLAGWFEAEALSAGPAIGLDEALEATRRRRPWPAWLAGRGSHWVGDAPSPDASAVARRIPWWGVRLSTALLLLLLVVALLGGAILVGARILQPPPPRPFPLGQLAYGLNGEIYVANGDASDPVRIADGAPGSACGSDEGAGRIWSPDGRYLAYRSSIGNPCTGTVVIYDTATKASESFPGQGWELSWSPDSSRIATWIDPGNTVGIYGVDGVRQAPLTVPPGCAHAGDYDPKWSSDGMSLIGRGCEVPVDGRPPQTLPTTDPRSNETWVSSPNGTRIAYVGSAGSLDIAAADGSQVQVLVPSGVAPAAFWPSLVGDR